MLPTEKGRCPDCWCELEILGSVRCEACHKRRREELAERLSHADEVGCQSSSEEFENSDIGGRHIAGNENYKNYPAMRSDVKWYIEKHGAG